MRAALVGVIAMSCGGNHATVDAGRDGTTPCSATFSGNFAETSSSSDDCPVVTLDAGDATLGFTIPTTTLATSVSVSIDLGTSPVAGVYSPGVVQTWSAMAVQRIGDGGCDYSAGSAAVPTGSFALMLAAIDPTAGIAHGALEITQYVLVFPGTDCGTEETETIALQF